VDRDVARRGADGAYDSGEFVSAEADGPGGERGGELVVQRHRLAGDQHALGDAQLHTSDVEHDVVRPGEGIGDLLDSQITEAVEHRRAHPAPCARSRILTVDWILYAIFKQRQP